MTVDNGRCGDPDCSCNRTRKGHSGLISAVCFGLIAAIILGKVLWNWIAG